MEKSPKLSTNHKLTQITTWKPPQTKLWMCAQKVLVRALRRPRSPGDLLPSSGEWLKQRIRLGSFIFCFVFFKKGNMENPFASAYFQKQMQPPAPPRKKNVRMRGLYPY